MYIVFVIVLASHPLPSSSCWVPLSPSSRCVCLCVVVCQLGRELLKSYRRAHLNDSTADMFKRLQEARDVVR